MIVLGCICLVHVLGQLDFIGKSNAFPWWANARISLDSPPDVPKLCGPTQQSHMLARCVLDGPRRAYIKVGEMGPCKWLGSIAFSMFWANSNSSARATHSHGGPMQELCLTALPISPNYIGPHNSLACWPAVYLMGQDEHILKWVKWADASAWVQLLSACSGPTHTHRQGQHIPMVGQCKNFA